MMCIDIPDDLQEKLVRFAMSTAQSPKQAVLEIIEDRIDHQSAYRQTAYLMASEKNRKRLNEAVQDIKNGIFEKKALLNEPKDGDIIIAQCRYHY